MKIKEDIYKKEQTHISIFEMKNEHKKKVNTLEAELSKYVEISQEQNKMLQNLKLNEEKIKLDLKSLETQKIELEFEIIDHLQEISHLKDKYEQDTNLLSSNLKKCQNLIEKKLFFNDEHNAIYNSFNSSKKYFNNVK